jgi:molybdenum cofactor biosynthesis enzyme MoaA
LTGGEPTINPDFVDFLTWLRQDDRVANLGFTTNGSASKSKYLQAIEACDWIAFSSHHEFMNVKKFQENVLATHIYAVKKRKLVWVNLMKEDASQDSVTELESWCEKHRVRYSIQKIHWGDDAQERRKLQL